MLIEIKTTTKNIQDVVKDDIVLSFNNVSCKREWQPVIQTVKPIVPHEDQVFVYFSNGGSITTSKKHPMLIKSEHNNWIYRSTIDLNIGDMCKAENEEVTITEIMIGGKEDPQFYDMTVEKNNNFFAGDDFDSSVVIHNSSTIYFPIWHYEVEDLIVLKNNKGTDETRIRQMDYCVQINGFVYQRLIQNKDITLFNPNDVQDLYEAFFSDQQKFVELYEKYENDPNIRQKTISALTLVNDVLMERNNTGRIYIQHVDHSNTHGAFKSSSPVRSSNLCTEILLPTHPLTRKSRTPFSSKLYHETNAIPVDQFREEYGEIALCTLGSINWGAISKPEDFEKPAELVIRALDELLDYQHYPMVAAGTPAKNRRSLGVGICNLAYFIAKHGHYYSDGSANELVHEYAEAMSYYLIKASVEIAKEKGACEWFSETKYSDGILPIDTYKSFIDEILTNELKCDWEELRSEIKQHGMRNSTVMALMPVESSSQIVNATNGIEPPRNLVSVKGSKDGTLKQVVPEILKLKNKYELLWEMPHTRGYLEIAGILQKFTDQSISTNTSYNPANYNEGTVPMSELLRDLVYAYKLGIATLYYQNTHDGSGEVEHNDEDSHCESCKL